MSKPLLVCILGPTASGKTDLAIQLAQHYHTDVISADSRQVFHEMRIGTARPSKEELQGVTHHLLGHKDLTSEFSAGDFEREALEVMAQLKDKSVVILAGGSGLYIKALLEGLDEVPRFPELREKLNLQFKEEGLNKLGQQLAEVDPEHWRKMDQQNPQRVIRALEVCLGSGRPFSSFHRRKPAERPFRDVHLGLSWSREQLGERISLRARSMLDEGLVFEADGLVMHRHRNALNTVGYKEVFQHLDGEIDLAECEKLVVQNTMRYAKRQMTWLRGMPKVEWLDGGSIGLVDECIRRIDPLVQR